MYFPLLAFVFSGFCDATRSYVPIGGIPKFVPAGDVSRSLHTANKHLDANGELHHFNNQQFSVSAVLYSIYMSTIKAKIKQ